jgi:class 3 adenylate cyclase/pimeloyl-ACP methyl ester carboxylesterase
VGATPETRYAKTGDVNIAYQVTGGGPVDLLYAGDWASHLDMDWEVPQSAAFFNRLGSFARLIRMNRRGCGLSDRWTPPTSIEDDVADMVAVLDAVGSFHAFVMGSNEGATRALVFAAAHPNRVLGLVTYAGWTKWSNGDDYEYGNPPELIDSLIAGVEQSWGRDFGLQLAAPGMDAEARARANRTLRSMLGPGDAARLLRLTNEIDIRGVLPSISAPTLLLHRRDDRLVPAAQGRYLAQHIADSRFVELDGAMNAPFFGDADAVLDEIEEFVTGSRPTVPSNRALTSVLFTDMVASTERATEAGDARWRSVISEFDRVMGAVVADFDGRMIKTTGDGLLATFDGPARAVRCAVAMGLAARALDLQVRVGVHTGEVEFLEHDLAGIGVHIGARVAATAEADQVLVTRTVRDLVAGSGIEFDDLGSRVLKGVAEEWQLFSVRRA